MPPRSVKLINNSPMMLTRTQIEEDPHPEIIQTHLFNQHQKQKIQKGKKQTKLYFSNPKTPKKNYGFQKTSRSNDQQLTRSQTSYNNLQGFFFRACLVGILSLLLSSFSFVLRIYDQIKAKEEREAKTQINFSISGSQKQEKTPNTGNRIRGKRTQP